MPGACARGADRPAIPVWTHKFVDKQSHLPGFPQRVPDDCGGCINQACSRPQVGQRPRTARMWGRPLNLRTRSDQHRHPLHFQSRFRPHGRAPSRRIAVSRCLTSNRCAIWPACAGRQPLPAGQIRAATLYRRRCGYGGIGRRARFRFSCRKAWGFESLYPHQIQPAGMAHSGPLPAGTAYVVKAAWTAHPGCDISRAFRQEYKAPGARNGCARAASRHEWKNVSWK